MQAKLTPRSLDWRGPVWTGWTGVGIQLHPASVDICCNYRWHQEMNIWLVVWNMLDILNSDPN